MAKEIYVVDQNAMRRPELAGFMAAQPKAKFVIPDTGLVEMVKSEEWEETFRRSFEVFVPVVTRCFMSISVQEALNLELENRASVEGRLLPTDFTNLLRGAIVESQSSNGPTMAFLRERMTHARNELETIELNKEANRKQLQSLVNEFRTGLHANEIKACRQEGAAGRAARAGIAKSVGREFYEARMKKAGVADSVSRRLWKTKSMTSRWCCLVVHHALQWLGEGGLDTAGDKTVVNDILDQDYVLLGSFFGGILSLETDVQQAAHELQAMLDLPPTRNPLVRVV